MPDFTIANVGIAIIVGSLFLWLFPIPVARYRILKGAPIVGAKWPWEPRIVTRYRFISGGWNVALEGWQKHREAPFTILRPDSNVTVLPDKYIHELHALPREKVHSIEALTEDMLGHYTGASILVDTRLNFMVAQNRLNPRLAEIQPEIQDELDYAFSALFPKCEDQWAEVELTKLMTGLMARVTFRLWVGAPLCRDRQFLIMFLDLVKQLMMTVTTLRSLPNFLHPIVVRYLPAHKRMQERYAQVQAVLTPMIEERRRKDEAGDPAYKKPEDFLQWMIELAGEREKSPKDLSLCFIFSLIASLFFVSNGLVDCIYDLLAYPEYLPELREESLRVLKEDGAWKHSTTGRMQKMDSFMRESQRLNTPSPISFRRLIRQPITLSSNLHLPAGTYVGVLNSRMTSDPDDFDANRFDGFRAYAMRDQPNYDSRWQFHSTDLKHTNWGYGRYACPGRFLAGMETKMILERFINTYDFRFPPGQGRPQKQQYLEFGRPDLEAKVLIRERKGGRKV